MASRPKRYRQGGGGSMIGNCVEMTEDAGRGECCKSVRPIEGGAGIRMRKVE